VIEFSAELRSIAMPDKPSRDPARDPQDLERLLVTRQRAGDVEGMMALYAPQAVVDCGDGKVLRGQDAIRAYFAGTMAAGRKFAVGEQRPAVISGDLALTSTRLPDGTVTAEVARRQADGAWLWVIDKFVNA
jgi:ketosteroid isomerase-like protein